MLVKRYVVKEMPEAVAMIREELGKDAVILSTKKVQTRGFLGLFSKTHIEVIAAANEQESKPQRPSGGSAAQTVPAQPVAPVVPRQAAMGAYQKSQAPKAQAEEAFHAAAARMEQEQEEAPSYQAPRAEVQPEQLPSHEAPRVEFPRVDQPTRFEDSRTEPRRVEKLPDQPPRTETRTQEPARFEAGSPASEATNDPVPANEDVLKEVQELRSLIRSFINTPANPMMPDSVTRVREQLLDRDLHEEAVNRLIERGIRHFQQVQDIQEQEFRLILTNFIKEELDRLDPPSQIRTETRIAAFIGPTGVGKTTTIAKLAAEQVLTNGKKVGLITTDTYRIAAVEQLRTYANILNVPLEVCYSPEDVKRAIETFDDRDLIFVDTAGRNYGNELNVKELNSYLQVLQPDETYLVLALTTKASVLDKIVRNFSQVAVDKLLFTKADETEAFGAIYNLAERYKIPLSYLTIGQNVPDDIETVSTAKLSSLIVGENSYA